jgi:cytochrome c oxidase subunit 2
VNEILRRFLFLPPQASTIAYDLDLLHYFVILTTMAGATLVTLIGGYFVIRYRRRSADVRAANPDAMARPHPIYEVGALVTLMVLFLTWWVIGLGQFMRIRVAPPGAMSIYVTAKQWMWKFGYPEGARSISTLVVPTGRPVKLVMTSRDVIHSFFVPDFRVKEDVIPGRYTTLWFEVKAPGTYPILCSQYCGAGHSMMRGEVVALSPEDYARWLGGDLPVPGTRARDSALRATDSALPAPPGETPSLGLYPREEPRDVSMVKQGERVAAEQGCLRCHTLDGTPHIGPTWAGLYGAEVPLEGGGTVVADEAYLTESIMDPKVKIHRGYPAVMPSYLGRLQAPDTAAIVELIKSLKGAVAGPRSPLPAAPLPPLPGPPLGPESQGRGAREAEPGPAPPGGEIPPAPPPALLLEDPVETDGGRPRPREEEEKP